MGIRKVGPGVLLQLVPRAPVGEPRLLPEEPRTVSVVQLVPVAFVGELRPRRSGGDEGREMRDAAR